MELFKKLSRRSVLKGLGALASGAALAGCSRNDGGEYYYTDGEAPETSYQQERIVSGVCRNNCTAGCHINIHVRGGRVVKTSKGSMTRVDDPNYSLEEAELDSQYDRICLRGLSHAQRMYHSSRITTPMIQRNKENRNKGDISTLEAVSWDEAITYLAEKLWNIYNDSPDGNKHISTIFGTGNYGMFNSAGGLTNKLFRLLGSGSVTGAFDLALMWGIHKVTGIDKLPYFTGNEPADLKNADVIFTWGYNLTETSPALWHFLADAFENGTKHVNIDVRHTTTSSKADYFVTVNSGSDAVLIMAMIQEIIDKNMLDAQFMIESTVAPFFVNPNTLKFVRASEVTGLTGASTDYVGWDGNNAVATTPDGDDKSTFSAPGIEIDAEQDLNLNGTLVRCKTAFRMLKERVQAYTPELAEKYTGVPAETTRELARLYAGDNVNNVGGTKKVSALPMFGPDHYFNGMQFYHALLTMASITGKIAKEGCTAGTFVPYGYLKSKKVFSPDPLNGRTEGRELATVYFGDAIKEQIYEGKPYDTKAVYVACCNPVAAYSDQKGIWLDTVIPHLDLIAVADNELTDTARHADIILPVCHWFECEDVVANGSHPFALKQDKAVNTLGMSLPDSTIARLIAEKLEEISGGALALNSHFNKTDEEYMSEAILTDNNENRPAGTGNPNPLKISYKDINNHKAVRYVKTRPGNKPFIYGEGGYFSTDSKRLEFFVEAYTTGTSGPAGSYGYIKDEDKVDFSWDMIKQQVLPDWIEPDEVWQGYSPDSSRFEALRADYPYQMFQEHTRWRVHTQWFNVEWLKELDPVPTVQMNPEDAAAKGLYEGDMVKVYNSRGETVIKLTINNGLPRGMVNIPKGWQRHQIAEAGGSGSYCELTNPKVHRALCNQPYFDVLVNIVKA